METLRIYQIECPEDKWREPLQELRYQFDQFKTSPFVSRLMSLLDQIEERVVEQLEEECPECDELRTEIEERKEYIGELKAWAYDLEDALRDSDNEDAVNILQRKHPGV